MAVAGTCDVAATLSPLNIGSSNYDFRKICNFN